MSRFGASWVTDPQTPTNEALDSRTSVPIGAVVS